MRGWNKCDECGRFAKPEELRFEERRWLTLYGDLREEYPQYHKEGFGCAVEEVQRQQKTTGNHSTVKRHRSIK